MPASINPRSTVLSDHAFTLAELKLGEHAFIVDVGGDSLLKRRLWAMGAVKGVEVAVCHTAPLGDPRIYLLLGYQLSLRNAEARKILLQTAG